MSWLILVVIAVFTDAMRIFADNYITDYYFKGRGSVSQKYFYGWFFIALAGLMAIIFPVDFNANSFHLIGLLFLAGCLNSLAGVPYYRAIEIEDTTNVSIFVQLAPIVYLIFGWFLLGESFSPHQLLGFAVILAGPFLIIATTRKKSRKIKIKAALEAALYVIISVIANIIFVKSSEATPMSFIHDMIFIFLGKGVGNLIICAFMPKWPKRFKEVVKKTRSKMLRPLIVNAIIGITKDFTYRAALTLAPAVAIASVATDSATPIVIFFLGILLTIIWPNFGREKLNRKTVLVHLIATILVVSGIIILQH
ncbi:DMT family transporter [Candidatus Saccharibacteria bacterium]|nr:DMT family transporter [Candidatus Saccharibacteria bacterium]